MATQAKKSPSRETAKSARTVLYRGVKITPMTGKHSALAEEIRDGLRSKSAQSLGVAPEPNACTSSDRASAVVMFQRSGHAFDRIGVQAMMRRDGAPVRDRIANFLNVKIFVGWSRP